MDYVEGKIYKDPSLPGLSPEARGKVYSAMNQTIAKIHSVDVEKAGIADYGKHGDYVRRQVGLYTFCYGIPVIGLGEDMVTAIRGKQDGGN